MLAGRAAFAGETVSDSIAAILEREPEWSALPSATPAASAPARRCLEKDPRQRLRDIGEARIELLSTAKLLDPVRPDQGRRAIRIPPRFAMWAAAAVVLALAAAGIIHVDAVAGGARFGCQRSHRDVDAADIRLGPHDGSGAVARRNARGVHVGSRRRRESGYLDSASRRWRTDPAHAARRR